MSRLAAVDIGSNTVHALVADAGHGELHDVAHYVEMPELGAEVARTGRIGPAKRAEALAALETVLARARGHRFALLLAGATAAVRLAADRDEFLDAAGWTAGVPVRLIGETREAELSFAGVASRHAIPRDWLMADVGGGSTELVSAHGKRVNALVSLPLGSGAYANRFLSDPPLPAERMALRAEALKLISGAPESAAEKLVVTGGTASNLPLVLSHENPPRLLDIAGLLDAERRLDSAPSASVAAKLELPEARVRALRAGVEILLLVLDYYGMDKLHVSHEGLRHGMLLAHLERGDDWWCDD